MIQLMDVIIKVKFYPSIISCHPIHANKCMLRHFFLHNSLWLHLVRKIESWINTHGVVPPSGDNETHCRILQGAFISDHQCSITQRVYHLWSVEAWLIGFYFNIFSSMIIDEQSWCVPYIIEPPRAVLDYIRSLFHFPALLSGGVLLQWEIY